MIDLNKLRADLEQLGEEMRHLGIPFAWRTDVVGIISKLPYIEEARRGRR